MKHPAVCNSLSTYSPTFLIMNVYPTELEGKTTELSYPFFTDSVLSKEKKNEYITHKTQSLLIHVRTVQISEHKLKMEVTNAIYSTTLKWRVSSLLTELELQVPPKVTFGTYRFSLLNVYSYKGSNYSKRTNLSFCLPTARTQLLVFQTHPINTSITKERIGFIFFIFGGIKEQAIRKHSSAEFLDLHHK